MVAAVAAGLPLATIANVQAADTKDVAQEVFANQNTLRTPMAETFTPQHAGQIDRVTLRIAMSFGAISMTVQIQDTSGGKPNGNVLGTSSFSGSVNPANWKDFVFNPTVQVQTNHLYAIVVTPSGNLTWYDLYAVDSTAPGVGQMWLLVNGAWAYQTSFGRDFAFQEWQVSGAAVNRPPALSQANGVLSSTEGATATNTGTYSDPDGDNVALSASTGTLTKTGTTSGNWSWSLAGTDEAPLQTVTITANDGHGGTSTVSFTVIFAPVPPTVTITGAPASGPEGTAINLTGSASSPSAADNASGFTYTWSLSKNGVSTGATSLGATFSFAPDDEGTFVVSLQAVDDGGNGATVMATVTGLNVKPTATIASITFTGLVLLPLAPISFEGGFTDPGKLDTHTGTFNYGDGTPNDVTPYAASGAGDTTDTYAYAQAGTYNVTYTVTDDDGGTSTATAQVKVLSPAQALGVIENYVAAMSSLTKGEKNSLIAKYRAAEASAARGDTNATCGQLGAALNELSAMVGNGRLSAADVSTLSSATWATHRALGCTKVKLSWLNLTL